MHSPKRQIEGNAPRRRRYRINVKKLCLSLVMLGCVVMLAVLLVQHALDEQTQTEPRQAKAVALTEKSLDGRCVVIDAGHGGFDPGAISPSGVREDGLNLAVAFLLREELEGLGAQVIMTRSDENALAETKDEDMAERRRIIEESGSDIVISIHMNAHIDPSISGPLALFMPGSTQGKKLADNVIDCLNDALGTAGGSRSESLYVLKSGNQPCVLVECGYLTNAMEEASLQDEAYQKKIAAAIAEGAAYFFLME